MAEDKRVSAAAAADFVGTPDAPQLLQRAWKLGLFRLQGVRPGDSGPVEIPATEGGRIDFVASAVGHGALFTTYRNVTLAWADVERLAQADFERELRKASTPASPPTEQAPQSTSSAANVRNLSSAEFGRAGGKKSAEIRRARRKWIPHATKLAKAACLREPTASHARIANLIADDWELPEVDYPGSRWLSGFVSKLRTSGQLPKKSGKPRK
jgi:hypothetical protein